MPDWVKDEDKWKKAKDIFKKKYHKEPKDAEDFAFVTAIYKKLGGRISAEAFEELMKLENDIKILKNINEVLK